MSHEFNNNNLKFRTWAEINLKALEHNIKILRKYLKPGTKFAGVCKANAYGHGIIQIAKKLQDCEIDMLCVASIDEGEILRANGINLPVLCLGYSEAELSERILKNNIIQAVGNFEDGKLFSDYAKNLNLKMKIHVKIDTGMSRLGFYWPEDENLKLKAANEIYNLCNLPGIEAEGIFTHFANADGDLNYTETQLNKFLECKKYLSDLGINFKISHASASSGYLISQKFHLDMCRFGIALYGYSYPDTGNKIKNIGLKPVMKVKSKICAVRNLPENSYISYGCTYKLNRNSKIAVLPVGYADCFPRSLSNNFHVKIKNKLCPVIGRVCMDMIMTDVTEIDDVKPGDVAVIYDEDLMMEAVKNSNTIIDEIICRVMPRVHRVYINDEI